MHKICVKPTTYRKNGKTIHRKAFCYKGRRSAGQGGGRYYRVRVQNPPRKGGNCRTHDVGRAGHTKRIACVYPDKGWDTQAWLLSKKDFKQTNGTLHPRSKSARTTYRMILSKHGKIHHKKGGGVDDYSTL
jgi:hypothetical protein